MNLPANDKFSVLAYSRQFTANQAELAPDEAAESDELRTRDFEQCVQEVRNYLVNSRGRTEEEIQAYSEALNRAVLGFEAERAKFLAIINDYLAKQRIFDLTPPSGNFGSLAESVFAEVIGLNVLELIMKQREGLEEIQVVGTQIYEVRRGVSVLSDYRFRSVKELERIQQNLVLFNNDTITPSKRWAEVQLNDGSRVTLTGFGFTSEPTLTLRFYTVQYFSLGHLCKPDFGTINENMLAVIRCILSCYFNMVIIGPTNSGKTNLMKAMISEMPDHERIVTIESRFELMLKRDFPRKNIVEYEISDVDIKHSAGQAFKLALRQSPKRICHAEIRDDDANIYVRACTRGHEGSMTTVHVNELEDVPDAITDMCMLDGRGMNPERLRKRIAEYVTQIGLEMAIVDGKRKVVRIGEFHYIDGEVKVRDIVRYDYRRGDWYIGDGFSRRSAARIMKYNPDAYEQLGKMGVIENVGSG